MNGRATMRSVFKAYVFSYYRFLVVIGIIGADCCLNTAHWNSRSKT